jgi:integrase
MREEQLPLLKVVAEGEPAWFAFMPRAIVATTFRQLGEEQLRALQLDGRPWRHVARSLDEQLYPAFGSFRLVDLDTKHFIAWARWTMAPRPAGLGRSRSTVDKHLAIARRLMEVAVSAQMIAYNPVRLPRGTLAPLKARDEMEEARQVLTLEEIRLLLFDVRIPFERRLLYAIILLTGARFGEAVASTWDRYQPREPLGELVFAVSWDSRHRVLNPITKTGAKKHVAVHPVLADFLALARTWWKETFGRDPRPIDLIAPRSTRRGRAGYRRHQLSLEAWKADLKLVGIHPRSLHKARHTFITRLCEAGAPRSVVKRMVHPPRRADSFDRYNHVDWPARCQAVLRLDLKGKGPQLDLF